MRFEIMHQHASGGVDAEAAIDAVGDADSSIQVVVYVSADVVGGDGATLRVAIRRPNQRFDDFLAAMPATDTGGSVMLIDADDARALLGVR